MQDPSDNDVPPMRDSDRWVFFPPKFEPKIDCEQKLATEELATAIRIIRHQKWTERQLKLSEFFAPLHTMSSLITELNPSVYSAIAGTEMENSLKARWFEKMRLSLAPPSPARIRTYLSNLVQLNELLLSKSNPALDGVAGTLVHIAKKLDVVLPDEIQESRADISAAEIVEKTTQQVRRLRSEDIYPRLLSAVIAGFKEKPNAAIESITRLNMLEPFLPDHLKANVRQLDMLRREYENIVSLQNVRILDQWSGGSLELSRNEIFHEICIYIREFGNYLRLAILSK